ncbi:sensor histidine kinase [Fodinicola feengrottensis]|uniref:histidine kinase n=1 Tax=Fodinicola feengrottensis TaxID=435914 RepID=A0ABN2GU71_9ACTN
MSDARTGWEALRLPPWQFLSSRWPWRALGYQASGALVGAATMISLVLLTSLGVLLSPVLIGLCLLTAVCLAGLPLAAVERRRMALMGFSVAGSPHREPPAPGARTWLRARLTESATWRELFFALSTGSVLWLFDLTVVTVTVLPTASTLFGPLITAVAPARAVPAGVALAGWIWLTPFIGLVLCIGSAYLLVTTATARATLVLRLLPTGPDPARQVADLTRSRARLVDGFEAERRRIERDLHDGAQQRLLALSLQLGLLRVRLTHEQVSAEILEAVENAHQQAKQTIDELRDLVQGIHPRVLADRGLGPAVVELAGQATIPIELDFEPAQRFPAPIEAAGYFTVAEALTNAVKHGGADRIVVTGRHIAGTLTVVVTDDGVGGADISAGSGLQGLVDRADAVGGTLTVTSPAGGPTVLRLDIPIR